MARALDAETATGEVAIIDGYVPIIDIAAALGGDPAARRTVAMAIKKAASTSGFFVITGHGVAPDLVRRMEQVNVNGDRVVLAIERYEPNVEIVLRSFLSMGVPVKPKKTALGRAARRFAPREPYWLRWASSAITTTLLRSVSTG